MKLFNQEQINAASKNEFSAGNNKSERSDFDENGLYRDLWPYRDEMREWANRHMDDIAAFLQYKNAKFKLIFADGFYHRPGDDVISLSVPEFKEMKDSCGMTIDQILFGFMHEIAHLKRMVELDNAGKHNHLAQFNYEERKRIEDSNNPTKFATLQPAYREFYNIMEDAIVNNLVFDTPYYGENVGDESRRRNSEVKDFYTNKAFTIFQKEAGGGYEQVKDPTTKKTKIEYIGEGKGSLRKISKDDYEHGFDWNKAEPDMGRSGQFLTLFMKNQMIGLNSEDIKTDSNPNGKHKLHEDASIAFTAPLAEAYEELLRKIMVKYKDDSLKLGRYMRFMSQVQRVPRFERKGNKTIESGFDIVPNVFSPAAINKDPVKRREIISCLGDDEKKMESIIAFARLMFGDKLKEAGLKMGIRQLSRFAYLDVFNKFKETDRAKSYSWTFPLKHNLVESTRIMRDVLEPIYAMLCILDDNFEVTLPPERDPQGHPRSKSPENPEKPRWQAGDKVRNKQKGSPNFGKKGVTTEVNIGSNGEAESVTVKYIEEGDKMANGIQFAGVEEEIYNPNENLKLVIKKGKGGGGEGKDDPREKEFEGEDEDEEGEDENEKENKGDEREENKDENGENKKPEDKDKPESGGRAGDKKEDVEEGGQDLEKIINPYKKALDDMIAQEEREENLKELKKSEENQEFQDRQAEKKKAEELLNKLREERKNRNESEPADSDFSDQKIVASFMELEKKLAPYAEKMAESWLEIVNNIASKIEIVKDKYYRSGKMDIKRLQKHFPEIEMGADVEHKRMYEQFIEKIEAEIRPKMLRAILAIDNSGSMDKKINNIRMVVMLLNSSLRSFRVLLKDKFKEILGPSYREDMDLVCDTAVHTFGKHSRRVKPFDIDNFDFLEQREDAKYPKININKERIETMLVFQKIAANENGTLDSDMWAEIVASHNDGKVQELLKENKMTEIIFQISDGEIEDESAEFIDKLKKLNIATAGMAIGGAGAVESLASRHGKGNVIPANTPDEIVEKFGELLKAAIKDKIEKPMMDYLEKLS